MRGKVAKDRLAAELSAVQTLLATLSTSDFAGRIGLEERADELRAELSRIQPSEDRLASVALYFGGKPVQGSRSIDAEFATNVLSSYQELVTRVWSEGIHDQNVSLRGIPTEASHLHITSIVHGSFGFVLEEEDENGIPLFRSALREANDKVAELVVGIADEDDEIFSDAMAVMNVKIFTAVRNFFRFMHKGQATFRLVEGHIDRTFDGVAVERAYERAEQTTVVEEEFSIEGELLGVIPVARRFEFKKKDDGSVISGKVGLLFSHEYLERVSKEQLAGKPCTGFFQKREIRKLGRVRDVFVLTKLEGI